MGEVAEELIDKCMDAEELDQELQAAIDAHAPGLYDEIPAAIYHRIDAASASRLKALRRSAAHMKAEMDHPKQTQAMTDGTAIHAAVLEYERFLVDFVILPDLDYRSPKNREIRSQFYLENIGKTVIDTDTRLLCTNIREALYANPAARVLLEAEGVIEQSVLWTDDETGQKCKSRADKRLALAERLSVLDLKSTINAAKSPMSRQVYDLGYHIQGNHYLKGLSKFLSAEAVDFIFLCVEKTYPFASAIYRLDDAAIELGGIEQRKLLRQYRECEVNQKWPGYPEEVQSLAIPAWALNQVSYEDITP